MNEDTAVNDTCVIDTSNFSAYLLHVCDNTFMSLYPDADDVYSYSLK